MTQELFIVLHKENLHEIIQVSIKYPLRIGCFVTGTKVLDHLVRVKHIASDLRPPLDLLLLTFKLRLLFLTLLEFYVIKSLLEDTEGILPVVQLRTRLCVLHNYS